MLQKSRSFLSIWVYLLVRLIGWVVVGCLGGMTFSIVIVYMHGKEVAITHLQALLSNEYRYFISHSSSRMQFILQGYLQSIPKRITMPTLSGQAKFFQMLIPAIDAALLSSQLLLIRLVLLLREFSLLLLSGLIGLIDGLVQRAIRRHTGARESARIYHHAKAWMNASGMASVFFALALPIAAIHREWIEITIAVFFGLATQVATRYFKKYL